MCVVYRLCVDTLWGYKGYVLTSQLPTPQRRRRSPGKGLKDIRAYMWVVYRLCVPCSEVTTPQPTEAPEESWKRLKVSHIRGNILHTVMCAVVLRHHLPPHGFSCFFENQKIISVKDLSFEVRALRVNEKQTTVKGDKTTSPAAMLSATP